ncbi:anthrax toxin receptor-like [Molossus nigricans]
MIIVPYCACRVVQGEVDLLCDCGQSSNQVPLMHCHQKDKGSCVNLALINPSLRKLSCSPKICLEPSQDCIPLNCCPTPICSQPAPRMLPLIAPSTQALRRTTPSLPHP